MFETHIGVFVLFYFSFINLVKIGVLRKIDVNATTAPL
jgi:hypothetical protein